MSPPGDDINSHVLEVTSSKKRYMCKLKINSSYNAVDVAVADNPCSLITIFSRCNQAIKAGGAVYVIRFTPVEIVPQTHKNCTEEVPKLKNRTEVYADPISYVIKTAGPHGPSPLQ
jgi:hypothetical protein